MKPRRIIQRKLHFCPACGFEYPENPHLIMIGNHRCPECGFHYRIDELLNVTPLDKLEQLENEIPGQYYP